MTFAIFFGGGLLVLLFIGLHVASAITLLAFGSDALMLDGMLTSTIAAIAWDRMNEFSLIAIPLFVLLGEILLRAGIADRMYNALAAWLETLPGGLLHTNTIACGIFAATSGSSVATAATIGTIAIPTLEQRGYNRRMIYGSLAAGGTLGVLIPPSILMIVYGALADVSVGKLFIASMIPGIVLTLLMSATIAVLARLLHFRYERGERVPFLRRLVLLGEVLPTALIFVVILGSIYFGLATPTEAAALGILAALGISAVNGTLSIAMLHQAFAGTFRTTSMILLIIVAAFCLNFVLALLGVPQTASKAIADAGLSPYATIWLLVGFYVVLGCFLEAVSMMVTTVGIVVPVIVAAGFDPLWFGVFLTVLMEISMITPPVGLNLYVVQNLRPAGSNMNDVFLGIVPFLGSFLVFITILIYFPDLALWLPTLMHP